jgi:hypothetical protein
VRRAAVVLLAAALGLPSSLWADGPAPNDPDREKRLAEAKEKEAKDLADFQERVNAAIARGADWLKTQQKNDGSYPGFDVKKIQASDYDVMDPGLGALVVLTLAHCGVPADDPSVKRGLLAVQSRYSDVKKQGKVMVYVAATILLALDAVYHKDVPGEQGAVKHDRYGTPVPPSKPPKCELPAGARSWMEELAQMLVKAQVVPDGGWRYPGNSIGSEEARTDLSNTQYALLGLDVAARCGIPVPPETWTRAAEFVLKEQEEEGVETPLYIENEAWQPGDDKTPRFLEAAKVQARGWSYLPGHKTLSTGAMTCAGVTSLSIVKERLWALKKLEPDLRKRIDVGLLHGIGWLSENFAVDDNPTPGGASQWHYYYLYGLERTGTKTGLRWLGKSDWYRLGGEYLLGTQAKDGGWRSAAEEKHLADTSESRLTQTCFALLFLKRATKKPVIPLAPPALTGGGGAPAENR